ncbi:MAG: ATP12 family protein [Rhodospirillales bacterium]
MKRFYARVEIAEDESGAFAIRLDGRTVKTPAKSTLMIPSRKLAEHVSVEWASQRDEIDPSTMPLTGLSNAAIDRVAPNRERLIEGLASHIDNDPLRFRAESPEDLVARETATWNPLLDDFRGRFGIALTTTTELVPPQHLPEGATCVRNYADARDDFHLTAFVDLAQQLGSVVVAIAALEGVIDAGAAFEAAYLEELHQADRWGIDKEAEDRRRAIRADIETALLFDTLAGQS